jgi:SAM-dependent methyltransferase
MHYQNKIESLKRIFGTADVSVEPGAVVSGGRRYPVVNDVIILTEPEQYTAYVKRALSQSKDSRAGIADRAFAEDIQFTFGEEWKEYDRILPEHQEEFGRYFDLADLAGLSDKRVCDLGCGMGRWSYFLKDRCKELVLVDFSDAIFVARKNLAGAGNCLFFMGDLKKLPFRNDFCDLLFSLGVLHHLPTPCLDEVRSLQKYAPQLLIFLYYALDNRPVYFRVLLHGVTIVRTGVSRVRNPLFRKLFSRAGTFGVYLPLVMLGRALKPLGLSSHVPLYDFYHNKSISRIEQDVYDRFFTRIEQRVSRKEILTLQNSFSAVIISNKLPYWHFLCTR